MPGRGPVKRARKGEQRSALLSHDTDRQVDESSPVIQLFRQCQSELDTRHDRHERIVKLSRDITIDSKRAIFLLHRVTREEKQTILDEAAGKLEAIRQTKWKVVANELHGCDPYQFLRAYSPGLQEYIEAVSFYHYLKEGDLISLELLENQLCFTDTVTLGDPPPQDKPDSQGEETVSADSEDKEPEASSESTPLAKEETSLNTSVHIPPLEYMLGIADLTGELMRMTINSVGAGDLDVPYENCAFLRTIHDGFVSFGNVSRELVRKLSVLRQSLHKVENACYALQVRGSEIPKHMLAEVFTSPTAARDGGGGDGGTGSFREDFTEY